MNAQLQSAYQNLINIDAHYNALACFVESEYNKILSELNIVTKRGTKATYKDMHRLSKDDYQFVTKEFRHYHGEKEAMLMSVKSNAIKVQELFVQLFLGEAKLSAEGLETWMPEFQSILENGKKYCQLQLSH